MSYNITTKCLAMLMLVLPIVVVATHQQPPSSSSSHHSKDIIGVDELSCTELCDLTVPISSLKVHICGTDGKDHFAPYLALAGIPQPFSCYRDQCGVGMAYPGTCGCPNNCYSEIGKGKCENKTCECEEGWKGRDCSQPSCPSNSCSGHGKCVVDDDDNDYCECEEGYTGSVCSVSTLNIPTMPYGEILPGDYWKVDQYKDHHPVFNLSVLAEIRVTMDSEDYFVMLSPANTWNQTYAKVNVFFSNGVITENVDHVKFKIKGNYARIGEKKSFRFKFGEKAGLFYGLSDIALKAPSLDPSYLHNQLVTEYYRSVLVPVSRGSFATLTINGVYWGVYWLNEEFNEIYIDAHYGSSNGNLYSVNAYMTYLGDNPEAYMNASKEEKGRTRHLYQEEFGDGNWVDFAALAKFLNQSTTEEFEASIENMLNIDNTLRSFAVESVVNDPDGYILSGHNYGLYRPFNGSWQYLSKDFELTMVNPFIKTYDSIADSDHAILARRLITIPTYHDIYNKYVAVFVEKAFNPALPNSAKNRAKALVPFLLDAMKNDNCYHLTNGIPTSSNTWELFVKELELFMDVRYEIVKKQFNL
eukprot:TRINITY_DN977_c0_g1_i1.p1 TRINITY_DN977_c0_g1~~TRINITY_DN977_c0_g1_i1.p1  ORF type:complete len:585 (+),score=135.52 TRINITY_DN977_c0_g1_i1:105-1859(+)